MHTPVRPSEKKGSRTEIPSTTQSTLLIANRHACCVCQKPRVQIHHIDEDLSNNALSNLAALCTDHHDMASMQIGLTKKLRPSQVRHYKATWEQRCREDLLVLARDRINFFVTLYKNPPRIRELFNALSSGQRQAAVDLLLKAIPEDDEQKAREGGFQFQSTPRKDERTLLCLASAANGELWPAWLPRVGGHPEDSDLPTDLAPPDGMEAFHTFDLYCQVLVRVLMALRPPIPLEQLRQFSDLDRLNTLEGSLVSFRERAYGRGVESPRAYHANPTSSVQFRSKRGTFLYRTDMALRNMYVFSDTGAENLRQSRVCGIGVFGGAILERNRGKKEIRLRVVPLIIGLGGFGQSDASGWVWNLK